MRRGASASSEPCFQYVEKLSEIGASEKPSGGAGIVPRGLRSFDAEDAGFFLELLPGPRDRSGLPEAVRFWKRLVEETDPDGTFRVGLIYGPSGCGKSSLVKAGVLPCLADTVETVFLEAVATGTEARLVPLFRKVPGVATSPTVVEAFAFRQAQAPFNYSRKRRDGS